ncbi:MAG: prepilin-type N-terminal cleavage/methylation domain-containing protein [Burkholderiaceae bacterium]|jgi:type IV fimbrial biogenesis protein FimT|nr:prepilin-type N-terminal cleavage/methylation domain-containing protein [Burkholderiaceae bacterium]
MADAPVATRGFTLIELLVTLSIAAILLAVAVPNFITFVQNNRLATQANDLVTMLNYARSEAVKRNQRVTVCSRATDTSCSGSTTWDTGLLVFVDADGDGTVAAAADVVQVRQGLEGSNTLRAGVTSITYQSNGFRAAAGADDVFRLCDTRGTASARAITLSPQGRVSTGTGTASCP